MVKGQPYETPNHSNYQESEVPRKSVEKILWDAVEATPIPLAQGTPNALPDRLIS